VQLRTRALPGAARHCSAEGTAAWAAIAMAAMLGRGLPRISGAWRAIHSASCMATTPCANDNSDEI